MPKDISSPFTPGRPVPIDFFVGRLAEVNRLRRKVVDAAGGRLEVGFLVGERGIGKSSLAAFVRHLCEEEDAVLGLHVFLGGVTSLEETVRRVFDRLLKQASRGSNFDKIKHLFGKHIRKVGLFGVTVEFDAGQEELRRLVHDFAPALRNLLAHIKDEKRGLLLVLDDVNGLASSELFANWLKSLVDEISTESEATPLCLLLVGLEERRQSLINLQPSLGRVFDPIEIRAWSDNEARDFFTTAFSSTGIEMDKQGLDMLVQYTGGLPVLAHEIGDAAFRFESNGRISRHEALYAVVEAADVVGRKYLEPQVFRSIRSERYRGILRKIAQKPSNIMFNRKELLERLTPSEAGVFDNFLRKMRDLGVLVQEPEAGRGVYRFGSRLHHVYFWLEAQRAQHPDES